MKSKIYLLFSVVLMLFGCAHHRDVRPGSDGIHRVVIATDDTEEGSRDAIKQANHFCESKNKSAAFIDENNAYKGDMSESDYKKAKVATKVAKGIGGAAWVFGGRNESAAGGILALGGHVADSALGNGYRVEMKFKCE